MDHYDVLVVGGGPAGANAGRTAATADASALVLEQGIPRTDRDELGPDSTDAAGMLDYWLDIMQIDPASIPEDIILQELDAVDFLSPNESITLRTTGMDATYDRFGFTFHRARMDDWMRERAESAGATYRVGASVSDITVAPRDGEAHEVQTAAGDTYRADALILADGPQRRATMQVLQALLPSDHTALDRLSPPNANHIAYQEHRRFPTELFEPSKLKFWWGYMPGETAYPWVFPNDDHVARVGFTMPIGIDIDSVHNPDAYPLLAPGDASIPNGAIYIERLLEHVYPEYDIEDFPLVTNRAKREGTETYAISSTRPIESPVDANIAIVGGAMGTTSAFHEGGYHLATRTGAIAGELAAEGALAQYNDRWQAAVDDELLRNVVFGDLVDDYEPADWDRAFATAKRMQGRSNDRLVERVYRAGPAAIRLYFTYKWRKFQYRNAGYVQLRAEEYER